MSDCQHKYPERGPDTGDVQTQGQQLDEQTREELVDRLIDCLFSEDGKVDDDEIDRYLAELDALDDEDEPFDVERSLREFHERYDAAFESSPKPVKKTPASRRPLVRIAIIAAALCAFMVTAQASGLDILGAIARWTSEQFSFVKVGHEDREPERKAELDSLQATLDEYQVTEKLAPTEYPKGTEFVDVLVKERIDGILISATFILGGENFYVSMRSLTDSPHMEVEINDPNVEKYVAGGIEHHLMNDVKQRKVSWYNGTWDCYIAGDLSRNDLITMIDSIYK